jgi:serine protease Do
MKSLGLGPLLLATGLVDCTGTQSAKGPNALSPSTAGAKGVQSSPVSGPSAAPPTKHPNLRALTVVVSAKPPPPLSNEYQELARRVGRTAEFFHGAAEGGFGSGFLVAFGAQRFVITNQHVVQLATHVSVLLDPEQPARDLPVVYVDPDYDLAIVAVLEDEPSSDSSPRVGLELDASPARDQQAVVASGYPAIGDDPSYQVTRGYVSNEHFVLTRAGQVQIYIQHTAPIDSGSSGGPLTNEEGKLLGVNTLKIRQRENVGLAIPASIVAAAIPRASAALLRGDTPDSAEVARATCEQLLAALAAGEDQLEPIERALGGELVAESGWASLAARPDSGHLVESFIESPTASLLSASALRLIERAKSAASKSQPSCQPAAGAHDEKTASFTVHFGGRDASWVFGWEQGRFKLVRDSSASKLTTFQILQQLGAVQPPKKKWKPSLR